jgi:hypothetical protein
MEMERMLLFVGVEFDATLIINVFIPAFGFCLAITNVTLLYS